ncbi:hypothetical protein [Actinomadura chokoriensis]|uniref:hypothetical protein n=1 Tax=Actinomadura chokoriensis TaxID=454156 RepID=UPI0031F7613A
MGTDLTHPVLEHAQEGLQPRGVEDLTGGDGAVLDRDLLLADVQDARRSEDSRNMIVADTMRTHDTLLGGDLGAEGHPRHRVGVSLEGDGMRSPYPIFVVIRA